MHFSVTADSGRVGVAKPDPRLFQHALTKAGLGGTAARWWATTSNRTSGRSRRSAFHRVACARHGEVAGARAAPRRGSKRFLPTSPECSGHDARTRFWRADRLPSGGQSMAIATPKALVEGGRLRPQLVRLVETSAELGCETITCMVREGILHRDWSAKRERHRASA